MREAVENSLHRYERIFEIRRIPDQTDNQRGTLSFHIVYLILEEQRILIPLRYACLSLCGIIQKKKIKKTTTLNKKRSEQYPDYNYKRAKMIQQLCSNLV